MWLSLIHSLLVVHLAFLTSHHMFSAWISNDDYWLWSTSTARISIFLSFVYFIFDLRMEVCTILYTHKRNFANMFHAVLCTFVYGLGVIFQIGHYPLVLMQFMEVSTIFYNIYLISHGAAKRITNPHHKVLCETCAFYCGLLFAVSFFVVRIVLYGWWYIANVPLFYRVLGQSVCTHDILDNERWCLPMNPMAICLFTSYYVLNICWFHAIITKLMSLQQTKKKHK